MAVHTAGGWRVQRRQTLQRGLCGLGLYGTQQYQIVNAIGTGTVLDGVQLGQLIGQSGHNEFSAAAVTDATS